MGEEDGSPAGVEVVTGATHSTHSFINYAQQLVNAAKKATQLKSLLTTS